MYVHTSVAGRYCDTILSRIVFLFSLQTPVVADEINRRGEVLRRNRGTLTDRVAGRWIILVAAVCVKGP